MQTKDCLIQWQKLRHSLATGFLLNKHKIFKIMEMNLFKRKKKSKKFSIGSRFKFLKLWEEQGLSRNDLKPISQKDMLNILTNRSVFEEIYDESKKMFIENPDALHEFMTQPMPGESEFELKGNYIFTKNSATISVPDNFEKYNEYEKKCLKHGFTTIAKSLLELADSI
jgi:hypothetical protein